MCDQNEMELLANAIKVKEKLEGATETVAIKKGGLKEKLAQKRAAQERRKSIDQTLESNQSTVEDKAVKVTLVPERRSSSDIMRMKSKLLMKLMEQNSSSKNVPEKNEVNDESN